MLRRSRSFGNCYKTAAEVVGRLYSEGAKIGNYRVDYNSTRSAAPKSLRLGEEGRRPLSQSLDQRVYQSLQNDPDWINQWDIINLSLVMVDLLGFRDGGYKIKLKKPSVEKGSPKIEKPNANLVQL